MGSSVTLPMLPQAAFLSGLERAIGVGNACLEELSGVVLERDLGSRKGVSEAFWGAIGNKVNDIPCGHFCAEAYANQESLTSVLQRVAGYPPGSFTARKL